MVYLSRKCSETLSVKRHVVDSSTSCCCQEPPTLATGAVRTPKTATSVIEYQMTEAVCILKLPVVSVVFNVKEQVVTRKLFFFLASDIFCEDGLLVLVSF